MTMAVAELRFEIETNAQDVNLALQRLQEAASASVEVRDRLAQLGELRLEDFHIDRDRRRGTGRTGLLRLRIQFPERFRELVAAVAGDLDVGIGE
jgi:hypothetical protein